jgi:hypothetical protein
VKTLAALLSVAAIAAAPASGALKQGFSFGRSGGNIRPLEVRISAAGRVVVDQQRRGVLTQARLRALLQVVERERFATLPARIVCKGVLPDIATRHVAASGRSVTVQGGCSVRFDRVYAALARAAGVT